jgi:activator of 2-hydroxyglutaryl-CoA dehydratase
MKKSLVFKTEAPLSIGLDIGGTLTKISLIINKKLVKSNFAIEYDFIESLELNEQYLYLKNIQTGTFENEGINLLRSISL